MKLRIQGDSIRLRIAPSELDRLINSGRVQETIHFSPDESHRLTYALEHRADVRSIEVRYEPALITVLLPAEFARAWAQGSDVGVYGAVPLRQGQLQVAIEKDWACLDKSDADNADTFPNPNQGTAC